MKRLKKVWLMLILPFTVLSIGCAQRPVYKAESLEDVSRYYQGREVIVKNDDIAETSIEFEEQQIDEFIFYVEIENLSDSEIVISPDQVFADYFLSEDNFNNGIINATFYSVNPEKRIAELNSAISGRHYKHDAVTGLNIIGAAIDILSDVSSDNEEDIIYDVGYWADSQANEEIDFANSLEELSSRKEFWENEVLRKTSLQPEERIGGLVFIPVNSNAQIIQIFIPAGKTLHGYLFELKNIFDK